jgi:hypothetical protein
MVVARACEEEDGESLFNESGVSVLQDQKSSGIGCGCTLQMYSIPLNCTFKQG